MDKDKERKVHRWIELARLGFGKSFWGFFAFAVVSGIACYAVLGPEIFAAAIRDDFHNLLATLPRIAVALGIAGLVWVLLPRDHITRLVGTESGFRGLLIAAGAGMVTPGGPSSAFSLLVVLAGAGADRGAMVTYASSWAMLGFQRILIWDVPFMGPDFATKRFLVCLPLVIVAGLIARRLPLPMTTRADAEPAERTRT